ncbi:MAG: twin-arginine translocase subunit TatC, partial [Deltaproteobacteria bacterium]
MDIQNNPVRIKSQLDEPIPLLGHLDELRKCLIVAVIAIVLCSIAAYSWVDPVLKDIARPIGKLYFTSPMEAFWSRLKLSFFMGIFLSMPLVLSQVWRFVQRGLFPKEKRFIFWLVAVSFLLFAAGASFCYFVVMPAGVKFLMEY